MVKRKNKDVEKIIIGIQKEKALKTISYLEFNNFEVDILDSCNMDYDKQDNIMLNCGHIIISYISVNGIIGLLHILNKNPFCLQCNSRINHIRIFPEKTIRKNVINHKKIKNSVV